ncbi:MAG: NAD-dependent oxidoreductase [Leptothrix sp. (in: Bacteria)]|nr:NAD-dependent oxidoreductase [Leptothrix sp. (in: b-proteobacteria)]
MTDTQAPENSLASRRVLVTGGLGVLGRAVGHALAARGARVVLLDRAPVEIVHGMAGVLGDTDLGHEDDTAAAVAEAARLMDGLNALVNVAGGFRWEKLTGGSLSTWDAMYSTNLRSAVAASRTALPHLRAAAPAAIVNVGALAAIKAGAGMGAYAASKAGVARLTEALAEELKDEGVRVNAVLPSILDTPANRADMPDAYVSRWVTAPQLAAVVAFLLSDDAAAVTGACIPVAGRV